MFIANVIAELRSHIAWSGTAFNFLAAHGASKGQRTDTQPFADVALQREPFAVETNPTPRRILMRGGTRGVIFHRVLHGSIALEKTSRSL